MIIIILSKINSILIIRKNLCKYIYIIFEFN